MRWCGGIRSYAAVVCGMQENASKNEVQFQGRRLTLAEYLNF